MHRLWVPLSRRLFSEVAGKSVGAATAGVLAGASLLVWRWGMAHETHASSALANKSEVEASVEPDLWGVSLDMTHDSQGG